MTQIIRSAEELRAMPVGTIILDADKFAYCLSGLVDRPERRWLDEFAYEEATAVDSPIVSYPAVVLYNPEAEGD